jgi:hypothetical protein
MRILGSNKAEAVIHLRVYLCRQTYNILIMKSLELIQLYYYLCECYDTELRWYCQRFSPNRAPDNLKITDAELLAIYFYCRLYEHKHTKSQIHDFARRYMLSWFPHLPNYSNFNARINAMDSAVTALVPMVLQKIESLGVQGISEQITLFDSFPVMLCSGKRQGKVATELSDKGYCATKDLYYYGVKLHVAARRVQGSLPLLEMVGLAPASQNDLAVFKPIADQLAAKAVFADKAYADQPLNARLIEQQDTFVYTPVKLVKGHSQWQRQFDKAANDLWSSAVSRLRQPIEALFNWINEKTGLQNASKVRATKGLIVQTFGALATALFHYIF